MTQENPVCHIRKDPPPLSIGPQKVILLENGGWKAVIECHQSKSDCNSDYELSIAGAGINSARRAIWEKMIRRV